MFAPNRVPRIPCNQRRLNDDSCFFRDRLQCPSPSDAELWKIIAAVMRRGMPQPATTATALHNLPPWCVPPPASGDSWARLMCDRTFVANNTNILRYMRILHRLCQRYPIRDDTRIALPRYNQSPYRPDGRFLCAHDIDSLFRAMAHGPCRNIFDNPIWEAWRTAPGGDVEEDPDMDYVIDALNKQEACYKMVWGFMKRYREDFVLFVDWLRDRQDNGDRPPASEQMMLADELRETPTSKVRAG